MHWLCYGLHALLLALHVVLALFLIKHPEHNLTISTDNPWATTALTVSFQAFYVVDTSLHLFHYKTLTFP